MVTKDDVRAAYRLILGREPENEEVLAFHAEQFSSLEEMRAAFFSSPEFHHCFEICSRPLDWPPIKVEVDAKLSELSAMMRHMELNWSQLGISEPHWSVLSKEAFRAYNIVHTEQQFFDSGRADVDRLKRIAERCGVTLSEYQRCFELGCGVGRMTTWLADLFNQVVAADISQTHLALARQALHRFGRTNADLVHFNSFAALDTISEFDFFCSLIVLQHNPPPLISYLLQRLLNKLRPGGIAYFQVPTYRLNYSFQIGEYLNHSAPAGIIEMHLIPQVHLFNIIQSNGCRLLECREDPSTGDYDTISNVIFAKKRDLTASDKAVASTVGYKT